MNKMGNKGGVGVRFTLYESSFCFINVHLFPHQDAVAKRNQNFHDIMKKIDLGIHPENHDYLFWLGDFNYRIDGLEDEKVKQLIKEKKYSELIKYDQLSTEKKAGRVLFGFEEGQLNFAPTYKYDKGTNIYDTSEKQRIPSWTDRVLWKGNKKDFCKLLSYNRYELLMSDHRPGIIR